MKIGYFADGPWGHNAFRKLIEDDTIEIVFMMVRFDARDKILMNYAREYNIPLLLNSDVNSQAFLNEVVNYGADLFVSMSFNQIFKEKFISIPSLGTINCHAGKLPFYRGRNILNWVLINDEKEFGITVHYVDAGIDTGDIILQKTYPITDEDDYGTLLQTAYVGCADVLYDAIKMIQAGSIVRIKQDDIDPVGIYCGMRQAGDEIVDWNRSSREIFNFVRAICRPGPCARTYKGSSEIFINKVNMISGAKSYIGIPGQVIGRTQNGYIVKTRDTFVEMADYSSDVSIRIGDRFTQGDSKK